VPAYRDGEDCLRPRSGRVPQPSHSSEQRREACRAAAGRERRATFFGYFLCSHKESASPAGGETPAKARPRNGLPKNRTPESHPAAQGALRHHPLALTTVTLHGASATTLSATAGIRLRPMRFAGAAPMTM